MTITVIDMANLYTTIVIIVVAEVRIGTHLAILGNLIIITDTTITSTTTTTGKVL